MKFGERNGMEEREDDNLYELPEEEDEDDKWGLNYAQASHYVVEDDDEESEDDNLKEKRIAPFLIMLKILFSPVEGWKSLRRAKISVEKAQSECFYPLLAILGASSFILFAYIPNITFTQVVVRGFISFLSFFFGYFCVVILLKLILPKYNRHVFETEYGKVFLIMSLSTLSLFAILTELLPMLWAILIFLPVWTIYSMCKGMKFFKLPDRGTLRFTVFVCCSVIIVPYAIDIFLEIILPK